MVLYAFGDGIIIPHAENCVFDSEDIFVNDKYSCTVLNAQNEFGKWQIADDRVDNIPEILETIYNALKNGAESLVIGE